LIVATGGLGDRSFNDSGYAGVERAKKELGIEFDYVEPKEIAEYESNERAYAQKGTYDLIVGLGFDQADPMKKVATDFPKQKWLMIDGFIDGMSNVRSITFKDQEKAFLIGGYAAQLTTLPLPKGNKDCVIGGVGGMDIPLIRAFAAGFTAGAKYVNPDCKVIINYVGGWADPSKAKEIAISMYEQGADIVYQFAGGSGLGVFEAAKLKDMYAIGTDVNQNYIDPDHIVLSAYRALDVVIYDTIKNLKESGKFEAGTHNVGLKEGAVGNTTEKSNVKTPQEITDKVNDMKAKVISGELQVPDKLEDVDAFLAKLKK
jgi:basic membrane protein A